ncbi:uncharacterized protein LAESUDRAFT_328995 [Laetiporus sulphureus 93-53]|uniref:Uncharacterized protein n=1 Tax=Laetiporus sulphureus 93-53 TaxID=1314785 RepID=A0A165CX18_9APHY|nr:uncharacterized protein LAESUDRAFT_328995 [Laetiporus sulphureus 93-53]KZT03627.1 hypothetical protein LAESUDRAFT_328995 [Laetiporus sulphureus 93-53]
MSTCGTIYANDPPPALLALAICLRVDNSAAISFVCPDVKPYNTTCRPLRLLRGTVSHSPSSQNMPSGSALFTRCRRAATQRHGAALHLAEHAPRLGELVVQVARLDRHLVQPAHARVERLGERVDVGARGRAARQRVLSWRMRAWRGELGRSCGRWRLGCGAVSR